MTFEKNRKLADTISACLRLVDAWRWGCRSRQPQPEHRNDFDGLQYRENQNKLFRKKNYLVSRLVAHHGKAESNDSWSREGAVGWGGVDYR